LSRETSYTYARDNLAELLDQVETDRDVVFIRRRGHPVVALVAAAELTGLLETAHLLRSPKNARRLLGTLRRALDDEAAPETVDDLRRDLGFETAEDGAA